MLEKSLGYATIIIILCYTLYNVFTDKHSQHEKNGTRNGVEPSSRIQNHKSATHDESELSHINSVSYAKKYITGIILHGSHQFGLKGGAMEGGLANEEDAGRIACYVLSLSGKKCPEPQAPDAAMYFTSSCGGCHGNDGRGLSGTYPDLTRKKLMGIEKRETFLRSKLSKKAIGQ